MGEKDGGEKSSIHLPLGTDGHVFVSEDGVVLRRNTGVTTGADGGVTVDSDIHVIGSDPDRAFEAFADHMSEHGETLVARDGEPEGRSVQVGYSQRFSDAWEQLRRRRIENGDIRPENN